MPNKIVITKDIPTNSGIRSAVNSYKAGTGYDMPQLSQTSSSIYIPDEVLKSMGLNKSFANYTDEDYNNLYRANDFYAYYNDGIVNGNYTAEDLNNAYQQYLAGKYSTADEINKAAEFGGKYYTYSPMVQSTQTQSNPTVQTSPDGTVMAQSPIKQRDSSATSNVEITPSRDREVLSRRRARELSTQNRGYNRGQFQLAMANAKNALRNNSDLRGKKLRQAARRMVAGVGEYAQPSVNSSPQNSVSTLNYNDIAKEAARYYISDLQNRTSQRSFREKVITPIDTARDRMLSEIKTSSNPFSVDVSKYVTLPDDIPIEETISEGASNPPITPRYTDGYDFTSEGKFDNAFAAASRAGLKTFTWNGKSYGTKKDPNWRERWGRKPKVEDATIVKPTGADSTAASSAKPITHQAKPDNWNMKDLLPEDFYNELNKSLEAGIDEEINNQQNKDIQNSIDNFKIDFGPTMKAPNFMAYFTNGTWGASKLSPYDYTFLPGWSNDKYIFNFIPKPGTNGAIIKNGLPEEITKRRKRERWLDAFTGQRPQYDK